MKSTAQINKEAGNGSATTLAVVDYRMGQLEIAVKEGFINHDKKLDSLTSNFATKEELTVVQNRLNDYRWYWRAIITALLFAIGAAVAALVTKR